MRPSALRPVPKMRMGVRAVDLLCSPNAHTRMRWIEGGWSVPAQREAGHRPIVLLDSGGGAPLTAAHVWTDPDCSLSVNERSESRLVQARSERPSSPRSQKRNGACSKSQIRHCLRHVMRRGRLLAVAQRRPPQQGHAPLASCRSRRSALCGAWKRGGGCSPGQSARLGVPRGLGG